MGEDKNLFSMLEDISSTQTKFYDELTAAKNTYDSQIKELQQNVQELKEQPTSNKTSNQTRQQTQQDKLMYFLKRSKKSWRWCGSKTEFNRSKTIASLSLVLLIILGLVSTIVSSFSFRMYSTFTLFENIWLIFGIIELVHCLKSKYIYEIHDLASHSSTKFKTDNVGMMYPDKTKKKYRVFMWLSFISIVANIIAIWFAGKDTKVLATIFEIMFLGAMIFALIMYIIFFVNYGIIWIEGNNLTTNKRVVLALPPGFKQLITEEEFNEKLSMFN